MHFTAFYAVVRSPAYKCKSEAEHHSKHQYSTLGGYGHICRRPVYIIEQKAVGKINIIALSVNHSKKRFIHNSARFPHGNCENKQNCQRRINYVDIFKLRNIHPSCGIYICKSRVNKCNGQKQYCY